MAQQVEPTLARQLDRWVTSIMQAEGATFDEEQEPGGTRPMEPAQPRCPACGQYMGPEGHPVHEEEMHGR